ncbi:hypothetical protein SCTVLC_1490 [Serratia symbiotica SCt-VLC]|uniref:Uncharacterized protein n=1 Tax=Serratia symbiotica SCt-VLC TaxID=1347341 RepID=A0A068RC03_9GAMM|nr:hypothetical protein SCTVLC_1490 [Serratia symbiotica SCt-VLC]
MRVLHFISVLSVLVGVAGAVLLTYGVWLIYPPAGFMIPGCCASFGPGLCPAC